MSFDQMSIVYLYISVMCVCRFFFPDTDHGTAREAWTYPRESSQRRYEKCVPQWSCSLWFRLDKLTVLVWDKVRYHCELFPCTDSLYFGKRGWFPFAGQDPNLAVGCLSCFYPIASHCKWPWVLYNVLLSRHSLCLVLVGYVCTGACALWCICLSVDGL